MTEMLLTIDELAERWRMKVHGVVSMVLTRAVPHFYVGSSHRGPKNMRFKLSSIESWELEQERRVNLDEIGRELPAASTEADIEAQMRALGWDGVHR